VVVREVEADAVVEEARVEADSNSRLRSGPRSGLPTDAASPCDIVGAGHRVVRAQGVERARLLAGLPVRGAQAQRADLGTLKKGSSLTTHVADAFG
jgi:hypothetical protein